MNCSCLCSSGTEIFTHKKHPPLSNTSSIPGLPFNAGGFSSLVSESLVMKTRQVSVITRVDALLGCLNTGRRKLKVKQKPSLGPFSFPHCKSTDAFQTACWI
ncbi:RGD1562699 [Phodopus roborovskii]|uniref:RGD1562699 protein n=1 Tax=Phodopus roborovskii TaxID=109678 RepID=A0AAU9ZZY2_PHORO|nr:RGD1562699 [Phodopus roborovskii]